jgi:hypothetical protein
MAWPYLKQGKCMLPTGETTGMAKHAFVPSAASFSGAAVVFFFSRIQNLGFVFLFLDARL